MESFVAELRWEGGGSLFLAARKRVGYLDRLRQNLEILDEEIGKVQSMRKAKRGSEDRAALQWAKLLRDLVEQRTSTLTEIKAHLLGRDQSGAVKDPPDHYVSHSQIVFERDFRNFLEPWKESDLRIRCESCGVRSEDVFSRAFSRQVPVLPNSAVMIPETEYLDLCPECYEKRRQQEGQTSTTR